MRGISPIDETQYAAELEQAFLRHLPARLARVYRKSSNLAKRGWDINALAVLYQEIQDLAGICGRYSQLEMAESLFNLELFIGTFIEQDSIPDADQTEQFLHMCERFEPNEKDLALALAQSSGTMQSVASDGVPRSESPPVTFISRFAQSVSPQYVAADEMPQALTLEQELNAFSNQSAIDGSAPIEALSYPTSDFPASSAFVQNTTAMPTQSFEQSQELGRSQTPEPISQDQNSLTRIYHLSDASTLSLALDRSLAARGVSFETIDDTDELIEVIGALTPHLVIVDSGYMVQLEAIGDAVRKAKVKAQQRVALLCLTTEADISTRLKAMRSGVDTLVHLPVSLEELDGRIDELLRADSGEPFRVLIVEDDRSQAIFAESILRKAGMETCTVMEPLGAMDALETFSPELILMDLYMPSCDGMELTALIRENPQFVNTPIVFLSGEHNSEKRFDALSAGGDDYLEKPIRPKFLIQAVTNRVRRARILQSRSESSKPLDPVSGLYERAYVLDKISETLASPELGTNLGGVLFLIVEGTHDFRERLGLAGFESLLRQAGTLLASLIAVTDAAARYGDSTFVVLAAGSGESALADFGEQLRKAFEQHVFEMGERSSSLAISVGVATFAQAWPDCGSMLNAAERACAMARTSPDQRVVVFDTNSAVKKGELSLLNLVAEALQQQSFQLLFQPIAPLQGSAENQFQALLRLREPDGRIHNSTDIAKAAEQADLTSSVDKWLLNRCLMICEQQNRQGREVKMFAAQSLIAFADEQRLIWLRQQMEMRKVNASQLVIEFRFSELLARIKQAIPICEKLHSLGLSVAITEFEASISSYQILGHLKISHLKISSRYLGEASSENAALAQELEKLIAYAHAREIKVIAPKVETAQHASMLWSTGIDYIQGNFVQQASPDMHFSDSLST